jgi:hypothetical protein
VKDSLTPPGLDFITDDKATQRFSKDAKTAAKQLANVGLPVPPSLRPPRVVVRAAPGAPLPSRVPPPPEPLVQVRPTETPWVLPVRSKMKAGEWGRVNEGGSNIKHGHLALVEGEGSVCLVSPRTAEKEEFLSGREDHPSEVEVNFKFCRPRLRNRKTNEIVQSEDLLTRFARPTWEELGVWEVRAGGPLHLMRASCPGLRLAPGCRVVVPAHVQGGVGEAAGWVITVEDSRARVRISKLGEAMQQTDGSLRNFLLAKPRCGINQDLVVEITDLRRHVLSFPAELRVLDRIMVAGLGRGRVKAIPAAVTEDPEVKVVLENDEEEVDVAMSFVTRVFRVGDVVDVVGGPFIGAWGIIVRVDDPKDGPSADIFAVSSPPTEIRSSFLTLAVGSQRFHQAAIPQRRGPAAGGGAQHDPGRARQEFKRGGKRSLISSIGGRELTSVPAPRARIFPVQSLCRSTNVAVDGAEATGIEQYAGH